MILQQRIYPSSAAAAVPNLSISRHKQRAPVFPETAGAVSCGWRKEFNMSLWGENSVLIAMTSVAFGERSARLTDEMERARAIAPVLPEIRSSLQIMQTRTRFCRDGRPTRKVGYEPSIHRCGVISKSGAVEPAASAGRCF